MAPPLAAAPKIDPRAALKAFFRLAERWKLKPDQAQRLLGVSAPSTFFKWQKELDGRVPLDTLERISYLVGIFKALHILLPDDDAADAWIRKPNQATLFAGRSALERMLSGRVVDLYLVRQYLDAQRGG